MKWNWGTKLFIGAALFMIMLIVFGVLMMRESISLVERDYYPKAQDFQKQIERRNNGFEYAADIKVDYSNNQILLTFPDRFLSDGLKGSLHMYNRNDDAKDAMFDFSFTGDSIFVFPATSLNGRYLAKISWSFSDQEYYVEKSLTVQ